MRAATAMLLGACLAMTDAAAQRADVSFFVIGKHASYEQSGGEPAAVDFSFFSEIFLAADGNVSGASLTLPAGETVSYRDMRTAAGGDRDNVLLVTGEARYASVADLQNRYPDGRYRVQFETPRRSVSGELEFAERPLPPAPRISIAQGNLDCEYLRPGVDLDVTWSEFREGRDDPNGILDDLVFVILEDSNGQRVAHSGRPFEGSRYLTHNDRVFTIDGGVLTAGSEYTLSVEHALLDDTTRIDGVPAFTTRAVTTRRLLRVAESGGTGCPAPTHSLDSQVTMFYYEDLEAASHFYGDILGLEKTLDWEWVRFFATGPASTVGIVRRGDGAFHDPKPDNAVMLSLVTSDIEAWYRRIEARDDVSVLKPLTAGDVISSFLLEDPGGYTVEFFEWVEVPER